MSSPTRDSYSWSRFSPDPPHLADLSDEELWQQVDSLLVDLLAALRTLRFRHDNRSRAQQRRRETEQASGQPENEAMVLTIAEAAKALRVGRSTAYELVRTNALPSVRIGRRRLIPRQVIDDFLQSGVTGDQRD